VWVELAVVVKEVLVMGSSQWWGVGVDANELGRFKKQLPTGDAAVLCCLRRRRRRRRRGGGGRGKLRIEES
jgi:hypothetical protein